MTYAHIHEWLAELERIGQEFQTIENLPELHLVYTLKEHGVFPSDGGDTFPCGHPLGAFAVRATMYRKGNSFASWFDVGTACRPFVLHWSQGAALTLADKLPGELIPANAQLEVTTYLKQDTAAHWLHTSKDAKPEEVLGSATAKNKGLRTLTHLEESLIQCLRNAPAPLRARFGDLAALENWPVVLLFLAMTEATNLLRCYGEPLQGGYEPARDQDGGTWFTMNDYAIFLEPAYQTATRYALDAIRAVATRASDQSATGAPPKAQPSATDAPAQGTGDTEATDAEWVGPYTKAEVARRIWGEDTTKRARDVDVVFKPCRARRVTANGRKWWFRIDGHHCAEKLRKHPSE